MLSKELVERAIADAKKEVKAFQLDGKYFEKFSDTPYDKEVLGYFRGEGGYYLPFMTLLAKKLHPKNILELGNYAGASTVAIYAGMTSDATFTTVDIVKDQRYCTNEMINDKRMRFIVGDVLDLSIYSDKVPMDVDFLYEDTFHYYDHITDIFSIYEPLLADKALIAIDDINTNDKRKFFDEFTGDKWDLTEMCHYGGWGVIFFERKKTLTQEERLLSAHRAAMQVWKKRHDRKTEILEKIEGRKFKDVMLDFLRKHKSVHSLILKIKKTLGIIPKNAVPLDEKRFYSTAWEKEMGHLKRNVFQNEQPEK